MITIYGLNLKLPWDESTIIFDTGFVLHFHKCPVCTIFKLGFDVLGFGLHFAMQRGKKEMLMGGKSETES